MNRGIYATAAGMLATEQAIDIIANNLANANTVGFKRDEVFFDEALQKAVMAEGGTGREIGKMASGPAVKGVATIREIGNVRQTGNLLDIAVNGEKGMIGLQTDRGTRYTRDGALSITTEGVLCSKEGHPVLDLNEQPIQTRGFTSIRIDSNGQVIGRAQGAEPEEAIDQILGTIGIFEGTFRKVGNNMFASTNAEIMDGATVRAGALEDSNVNTMTAMVQMISLTRGFEMAQRSIIQQDELLQRLIGSINSQ